MQTVYETKILKVRFFGFCRYRVNKTMTWTYTDGGKDSGVLSSKWYTPDEFLFKRLKDDV